MDITRITQTDPDAKRLQLLRCVGPVVATALIAAVGDARQFTNGRQKAASLGLTPRQHSSVGQERSGHQQAYVRSLLVHGARSALRTAPTKDDRLSQWFVRLSQRAHPNVACIALANKMARLAWALLYRHRDCDPVLAAA